ncbi:hypothetical protein ALC57_17427, partial [Trachymyrmex cornetzi]
LVFNDLASAMKEVFYHIEESRIRCLGHVFKTVRYLMISITTVSRCLPGDRCDTHQDSLHIITRCLLQGNRRPREISQMKHFRSR